MSGKARLGQLLVASAILAPASFGAYKWQTDPEFKSKVMNLKLRQPAPPSPPVPIIPPVVLQPMVVAPPPPPSPPPPPPPPPLQRTETPAEIFHKISLTELAELERKLAIQATAVEEPSKPSTPIVVVEKDEDKKSEPETLVVDHRHALNQVRQSSTQLASTVASELANEVVQAQRKLKQEIEFVLAKDLSETNDPLPLKQRIVQLTLELQDRSKWEALRLHEVITSVTHELSQKFQQLFRQQEMEYENIVKIEVASACADAVQKTESKLRYQLDERLQHQKDMLKREMDALVLRARDEERVLADEDREKRTQLLERLVSQIGELSTLLAESETTKAQLKQKLTLLQLASTLQTSLLTSSGSNAAELGKLVEERLGEIRVASKGDKTVCELLDQLPHRVFAAGLSSPSKLASEFKQLQFEDNLVQQSLDKVSKMLTIGGGPSVLSGVDSQEVIVDPVAQVTQLLQQDRVLEAVQLVEASPSLLAKVEKSDEASRWLGRARDRLKVEATLRVLIALVVGWACAAAAVPVALYYYVQHKEDKPDNFSARFSPNEVAAIRKAIAEAEEQAQH
ncbi:hypothetical protein BASA81_008318 [Batrachochytrium salamandrivorans]|nr:hypothetical protein BASA81_008318 [Batrachochytrium salamandrivorans]